MQEIETDPAVRGRRARRRRPLRKGGLAVWAGIAVVAAALALSVWACSPKQAEDGPEAVSDPPGTEEPAQDTQAPRLLGVKDITVAAGGTVSYRDGVSAVDDVDGTVPFQVDAGAVNLAVPGVYRVVYSAVDAAGNRAEAAATVTVEEPPEESHDVEGPSSQPSSGVSVDGGSIPSGEVTEEDVNRLADQILAQITRAGMSQREKARAIYNYVYSHIRYSGSSDKSSWIVGAYVGFTRQRGDCYNYFACSKALLTRAGIPNIDLTRVGGTSRHYWQLVNVGDGWYHFDACWMPTGYPLNAFLITEAQARAYTQKLNDAGVRRNYYVYDYDSCPVRVEGTPEGDPPPAVTPNPPAVTEPPVATDPVATPEPPVVTDPVETPEPPVATDPVETPEPPVVTDPVETQEPPVATEPPAETQGPPVEETEPPAQGPSEPPAQTDLPADSQQPGQPGGGE